LNISKDSSCDGLSKPKILTHVWCIYSTLGGSQCDPSWKLCSCWTCLFQYPIYVNLIERLFISNDTQYCRAHQRLRHTLFYFWICPNKGVEYDPLLMQYHRLFDVQKVECEYLDELSSADCEKFTIATVLAALSTGTLRNSKSNDQVRRISRNPL
jgi:hypothetical protein